MSNEKLFYFYLGGIMTGLTILILQYSRQLETRNAYQQGTIDNQRLWLEHEKGEKW
ncbi:hypothetical protein [Planktothrix sp. FACHB-1365]|uniref:hypothetical protein n=1 Tax=Planktothrix sp. FACHB-1365 TaxID=2692855 RepID=UPI00168730B6|nr:hypothetical protein [Planktothrix sp. FACHB-1365]MBD2485815.1 hypothetical protein [Planktothrix sp. FACHB-1365]